MDWHLEQRDSLWTNAWCRIFSHAVAFLAGTAITVTLALHVEPHWNFVPVNFVPVSSVPERDFDHALQAIMVRMGSDMCITPSGDADLDFARAMIPHHRAAIEMARLELLHGRDARLRRLAQGILVEQDQEITLMRSILDPGSQRLPESIAKGIP
jgi:DUF305 family protein family protein